MVWNISNLFLDVFWFFFAFCGPFLVVCEGLKPKWDKMGRGPKVWIQKPGEKKIPWVMEGGAGFGVAVWSVSIGMELKRKLSSPSAGKVNIYIRTHVPSGRRLSPRFSFLPQSITIAILNILLFFDGSLLTLVSFQDLPDTNWEQGCRCCLFLSIFPCC